MKYIAATFVFLTKLLGERRIFQIRSFVLSTSAGLHCTPGCPLFRCENREEEKQRNIVIQFTVLLKGKTLKVITSIFADTDQNLKREVICRSLLPGTEKVGEGMRRKRAATKNILMKVAEEGLLRAFLCLTSCVGYMCTAPIKEVLWHQYNTCVVDMEKKRR